ncbi:MAG: hypothetical protein ACRYFX_17280 [Janthinobacterium lividum]
MDSHQAIWKSSAWCLLFYGCFAAAIAFLEHMSPSGICTPGAGVIDFLALPVFSVVLMLNNSVQALAGAQPQRLGIATLHLLALAGFMLLSK